MEFLQTKCEAQAQAASAGVGFPNALPIDIVTAGGKRRIVLKPTSKITVQHVKLNEAPASITIDPDNTVLKEAQVTRQR